MPEPLCPDLLIGLCFLQTSFQATEKGCRRCQSCVSTTDRSHPGGRPAPVHLLTLRVSVDNLTPRP